MKKLIASLVLAIASVSAASAITFDVYNNQGTINGSGVFTYTVSGVTLTANAYSGLTADPITLASNALVSRATSSAGGAGGLGVNGVDDTDNEIDQASNTNLGEGLVFTFGGLYKLESVTFSNVNSGDDFDFAVGNGGNPTGSYLLSGVGLNGLPAVNTTRTWDASGLNYVGTNFLFASIASQGETNGEDRFRIASITVSAVSQRVPDSASTMALLGATLVVGVVAARRFRAA